MLQFRDTFLFFAWFPGLMPSSAVGGGLLPLWEPLGQGGVAMSWKRIFLERGGRAFGEQVAGRIQVSREGGKPWDGVWGEAFSPSKSVGFYFFENQLGANLLSRSFFPLEEKIFFA